MPLRKRYIVLALAFSSSLILYVLCGIQLKEIRSQTTHRLHATIIPIPIDVLKAIAGEFKGLTADYLFLEAASFNGSRDSFSAPSRDWEAMAVLLEQSSQLDPYFRSTYRLAQAALPWRAQKYEEALSILERSKEHLTWDWEPGFFIGFDHFFFLKDNLAASKAMMEASRIPKAPLTMATLASKLASKAGQNRTAIAFLTAMYEKSEEESVKDILKTRIEALQMIEILYEAIEKFKTQFQRAPNALEELVQTSILPALPQNPYNRPYTLKDGVIDF